jgi:Gpi18-like mannosyltransferase
VKDTVRKYLAKPVHQRHTWIALIVVGMLAKLALLHIKTGDYVCFLEPWLNFIKSHGYGSSLKYGFYDYAPSYIYILVLIAKLGFNPLFSVKIVSVFFEYVAAFFIGKIAVLKYKNNLFVWISMAVIPILPSVLLNSGYLSQCDSIYSAFVMGSVYYALRNKQFTSVILFGIAFAFKMQAVMLLPFYFVMMLRGNIRWYYFLLIPIIFIVSILPTWLYGRSFSDLLSVYLAQTNRYPFLTMNFPNLYILISNDFYNSVKQVGMLLTFLITLFTGLWLSRKKYQFSFEIWVRLAFLSAIIIPFLLPGMHERYMYLGDILGVLYFMVVRKNIHLPIGILLVSFYSYIRCSRFNDILPMEPAFVIYLLVVIFTIIDFITALNKESNDAIS